MFETRRPERRAWEQWAAGRPVTVDVPGVGSVRAAGLAVLDVRDAPDRPGRELVFVTGRS